jgi:hypothetical protein
MKLAADFTLMRLTQRGYPSRRPIKGIRKGAFGDECRNFVFVEEQIIPNA